MFSLPRHAEVWLGGYLRARLRHRPHPVAGEPIHVLFCLADHFEPNRHHVSLAQERDRVARWTAEYPAMANEFRDGDGRPPQHTFFFPAEVYRPEHLDALARICAAGYGEVEVHLHHGHDTAAALRARLQHVVATLSERHGLLSRHPDGRVAYAFIHGNWSLDNGGADASTCGVDNELAVLRDTGCYADFTMPAVPDVAQSRIVNCIYYAQGKPHARRAYDRGAEAAVNRRPPDDSLLLIEGPLMVWWEKGTKRVLPRIDSGTLDASPANRPSAARFARWVEANITVAGRANWVFVKVYAHGAPEENAAVLLGPDMREFHRRIGDQFNDGIRFHLHYVTAREMYNIVKAAEAGKSGDPCAYRDFAIRRITEPAQMVYSSHVGPTGAVHAG